MKEEKVLIQGIKTNYKILGSGPPFLIIHGWGSQGKKWQKVGELLAKEGFLVIIPDLPGFGESDFPPRPWDLNNYCDFIAEFIKSLNLNKFYLLGHSFGGNIAFKYALKFPEKIEKLFLVGAALIRRQTLKKKILFLFSKIFKIFSFLPFYNFFRKVFYRFFVRRSDYIYTKGIMRETYLKIIKEDLSDKLSEIRVPTIIIWGEEDKITPKKDAHLINKKIKRSRLIIISEAGHDLNIKAPEKLFQAISKELKG